MKVTLVLASFTCRNPRVRRAKSQKGHYFLSTISRTLHGLLGNVVSQNLKRSHQYQSLSVSQKVIQLRVYSKKTEVGAEGVFSLFCCLCEPFLHSRKPSHVKGFVQSLCTSKRGLPYQIKVKCWDFCEFKMVVSRDVRVAI